MARIAIDAHAIGERLTGNETYIANLIKNLLEQDSNHEFVLFFKNTESADDWSQEYPEVQIVRSLPDNPFLRIPIAIPRLVKKYDIDLLHVQYTGPPVTGVPIIVMIHDISYEHYPQYFNKRDVVQLRSTVPFTARKAKMVLTVSEYSKRDIAREYCIPQEKIVVTHNGVDSKFCPDIDHQEISRIRAKFGIESDYILTVSNLQPRKNLERLISAYTRLRMVNPGREVQLVIVGKKAWKSSPILAFIEGSAWVDDIILTDYVDSADLPALYAGARVFVYPSIFEGFGLPPLEAMACGTPVIVSDRTSLPEVIGGAGITVDPFDVNEIAASIESLLLEPEIAARLSARGLKRAANFSWADCARKTMEVYEKVIEETKKS